MYQEWFKWEWNRVQWHDEDIWYDTDENDDDGEEPTFYDSGMWVDNALFNHYNEADPITNDPINAPLIEIKFYKPRQRSS